jgi:hypothetical protein
MDSFLSYEGDKKIVWCIYPAGISAGFNGSKGAEFGVARGNDYPFHGTLMPLPSRGAGKATNNQTYRNNDE